MTAANFDGVARVYRWAEYACLGPALLRCRYHHLALLKDRRQALVLGDGDGRFTARLLQANPSIEVDAVDSSGAMLGLLRARCGNTSRLRTHQVDALGYSPGPAPDLVVAHFFFDCFEQAEVNDLVWRIANASDADAIWVISDFRVPDGLLHWPARIYIRLLYGAFRLLTGLRVNRLPDHGAALRAVGLVPTAVRRSLLGLLTTEVWQRPPVAIPLSLRSRKTTAR